jgi:DNA transformation protein and related proteins
MTASNRPMRNLGPVSRKWLNDVGIYDIDDLRAVGPVVAFAMVRQKFHKASLNLLWALAACLENIDWREIDAARKKQIQDELDQLLA